MKIAFIGIGNMGFPMAKNLIKAGHEIIAYDKTKDNTNKLRQFGGRSANTVLEVVDDCNVVITMLPDGHIVKEVLLSKEGVVNNVKANTVIIDCSTIDYETTLEISGVCEEKKLFFLDAPVSGGVKGADDANLTFMVGGSEDCFKSNISLFKDMGAKVFYVGENGSGQAVKACNNMLLGIHMIALGEVFTLVDKLGIDQKIFFDVSSSATGSSWAMLHHLPVSNIVENSAANKNFKPGFAASMMNKDLKLAQTAANSKNLNTPLGKKASELYDEFCQGGLGSLDYSAIIKLFE